jgi:hypothetical protein
MRDRDLVLVFYFKSLVFPTPFVEDAVFSTTHIFGAFVDNQMALYGPIIGRFILFHWFKYFCASTIIFLLFMAL